MIQSKPKKCKGINKCKDHQGCGKESAYRKYGLCPSCFWDWMQNTELGKIHYTKSFIPKVDKKIEKEKKAKDVELRESLKSIQRLIQEARKPFQKWIRLRDINKACISCESTTSEIWDAGHYLKAELYTGLIFDEDNCHKQCRRCNTFQNGNEANYRIGLRNRYGNDFVEQLENRSNQNRCYKFTKEELINIKKHYLSKIKEFHKQ